MLAIRGTHCAPWAVLRFFTGYEIADVVVNHRSVGAVASYTVKDIDGNTNIEVTFVKSGNAVVGTAAASNPDTGAK